MIRVLTFAPAVNDGTSFYRLGGVVPYLEKEYSDIVVKDLSGKKEVDWSDYTSYDVAIVQRPFIKGHLNTIKTLKMMGIKVIVDYDDDVLNLSMQNPHYILYNNNKENIEGACSIADQIWVSTDNLKKSLSNYNKNILVIPNAHNDYLFPVSKKRKLNQKSKNVCYRGGTSHEVDVYEHLDEWVGMINSNTDTDFYFMGARFPYMETKCGDNYLVVPGSHIIEYFGTLHDINPYIFIYTLEDTIFNKSKSNISWIESTYAGSAVIAPKYLDEFVRPGIINFEESFSDLFDKVKKDHGMLSILNDASWDYIQQNLLLSIVNQKRYDSIVDVKNRK